MSNDPTENALVTAVNRLAAAIEHMNAVQARPTMTIVPLGTPTEPGAVYEDRR